MIIQEKIITAFSKYLTTEGSSIKTQKNYLADVKDFSSWLEQMNVKKTVKEIKKETIQGYIENLENQSKSVATINRRLSSLRMFFTFMIQQHIVDSHPLEHISNLSGDSIEQTHKALFAAYEAKLKQQGKNTTETTYSKHVVSDFIRWVTNRAPT